MAEICSHLPFMPCKLVKRNSRLYALYVMYEGANLVYEIVSLMQAYNA